MFFVDLVQGVLHAGAVLDSGVIDNITAAGVRTEFSGKVHGAWSLIARSLQAPLRAFNLFSSLAAFSGSGGQGSYAAANAVLDSWAQALQAYPTPDAIEFTALAIRTSPAYLTAYLTDD